MKILENNWRLNGEHHVGYIETSNILPYLDINK